MGDFAERYALGIYLTHFPVGGLLRIVVAHLAVPQRVTASTWSYLTTLAVLESSLIGALSARQHPRQEPDGRRH